MAYTHNPDAYERAKQAHIKANAKTSRMRKFNDLPDAEEIRKFLQQAEGKQNFAGKMAASLDEWGNLTDNQLAAVRKIMAEQAKKKAEWALRDAASGWLGTVGEKLTTEAKVEWQTSTLTRYGLMYITGLRDAAGNILIHKGSAGLSQKGDTIWFTATVKAHETRMRTKQTAITRARTHSPPVAQEIEATAAETEGKEFWE